MELSLVPLLSGALSLDVIRGDYVPGRTLGSLLGDGWGSVPALFIVSPGEWGLIFLKCRTPGELRP